MNPLISIIIPVYNVEEYLDRCIRSVINQTYSQLQIILIDDGSTDKSGSICDRYETEDNRIIVIHQENKGVSNARNEGLKISTGDYIGFVDPDDWCEVDMFMALFNAINDSSADMARCNHRRIYNSREIVFTRNPSSQIVTGREALIDMHQKYGYGAGIWNTLFSAELLRKPEMLWFDSELIYGEDADFLRRLLLRCKCVKFIPECHYNYNKTNNQSATFYSDYEAIVKSHSKRLNFLESNDFPLEYITDARNQLLVNKVYGEIVSYISGDSYRIDTIKSISVFDKTLLNNRRAAGKIKMVVIISMIKTHMPRRWVKRVWEKHR